MEERPRWVALHKVLDSTRARLQARKNEARGEFNNWLKDAKSETIAGLMPTDRLKFQAKLDEGQGKTIHATFDCKPRDINADVELSWSEGKLSKKAFAQKRGPRLSCPNLGFREGASVYRRGLDSYWPKQSVG